MKPPPTTETGLERVNRTTALDRVNVETALRLPRPRHRRRSRWQRRRERLAKLAREGELARRLLLGAPLVAIGFAIWAFGGVYGWAYGMAYLLVFAALATWSVLAWRRQAPAQWRAVYWPMLGLGGLGGAQWLLHWSVVTASTATALLHLSAAGAVFVLVSQLYRSDRDVQWITTAFSVFTGALAVLAILQTLTGSNGIYWKFTYAFASPAGSFVNKNNFAGCMEMLLPISCVQAYWRRHQSWIYSLPWAAPPALGLAAVVLAASRGGIISIMVEAVAALVVVWGVARQAEKAVEFPGWLPEPVSVQHSHVPERRRSQSDHKHRARRMRGRRRGDPSPLTVIMASHWSRWATLLAAMALVTVITLSVGTQRLDHRIAATNIHAPSLEQRHLLNVSSWEMFKQHPWLGWGLGTWPDVYPMYAKFTDTAIFEFAHNDYLQMLSECGLAGAGCIVAFWGLWWADFQRHVRSWPRGPERPAAAALAVAAGISCLGILVHSWVDFNLHIPANLMLFFALTALAIPVKLSSLR